MMACWTSDHRRRPHDHCLSSSLSCTVFCRFWCSGTVACSERRFLFSFNLTCFTVMDCFHVCIFCINVSRWEMPQTDEAASSLYGPAEFGSEIRKADPEMSRLKPLKQMFNPRQKSIPHTSRLQNPMRPHSSTLCCHGNVRRAISEQMARADRWPGLERADPPLLCRRPQEKSEGLQRQGGGVRLRGDTRSSVHHPAAATGHGGSASSAPTCQTFRTEA